MSNETTWEQRFLEMEPRPILKAMGQTPAEYLEDCDSDLEGLPAEEREEYFRALVRALGPRKITRILPNGMRLHTNNAESDELFTNLMGGDR